MEYKEPQNRENDSETQEKEEYSFMQETIKDEAGAGKKWRNLVVRYVGLGLIFGAASCLGFYAVKPVIEEKFQGEEHFVYEKSVLEDGSIVYDIMTSKIKQRYTFTEI